MHHVFVFARNATETCTKVRRQIRGQRPSHQLMFPPTCIKWQENRAWFGIIILNFRSFSPFADQKIFFPFPTFFVVFGYVVSTVISMLVFSWSLFVRRSNSAVDAKTERDFRSLKVTINCVYPELPILRCTWVSGLCKEPEPGTNRYFDYTKSEPELSRYSWTITWTEPPKISVPNLGWLSPTRAVMPKKNKNRFRCTNGA